MWAPNLNDQLRVVSGTGGGTATAPPSSYSPFVEPSTGRSLEFDQAALGGGVLDPQLLQRLLEWVQSNSGLSSDESIALTRYASGVPVQQSDQVGLCSALKKAISPAMINELGLSSTQVMTIQGQINSLASVPTPLEGIAAQFRTEAMAANGYNEAEVRFRDGVGLISPNDSNVKSILDDLVAAGKITSGMSDTQIARVITAYVQDNFEYITDGVSVEGKSADRWNSISETVIAKGGDCEDLAILTASLMMGALSQAGYSDAEISGKVTLAAGYLVDPSGAGKGHAAVKLVTENGSELALDATTDKGPFAFSQLGMSMVFEGNDQVFKQYQEIDALFETAMDSTSFDSAINSIQTNLDDLKTLLETPMTVPIPSSDGKSFSFYDSVSGTMKDISQYPGWANNQVDLGFFTMKKETVKDYGGTWSSHLYTVTFNPDMFHDFMSASRDLINKSVMLFHVLNSQLDFEKNQSAEIFVSGHQDYEKAELLEIMESAAKYKSRFVNAMNTSLSKIGGSIDTVVSEMFTFVSSTNNSQKARVDAEITEYGRENIATGVFAGVAEELTGAFSFVRTTATMELNRIITNVNLENAKGYLQYTVDFGTNIALWGDLSPEEKIKQGEENSFLYMGQNVSAEVETRKQTIQLALERGLGQLSAMDGKFVKITNPDAGYKLGVGQLDSNTTTIENSNIIGRAGDNDQYVEFGLNYVLNLREYMVNYQNYLRSMYLLTEVQNNAKRAASEQISASSGMQAGAKGTSSTGQTKAVVQNSMGVEFSRQSGGFAQVQGATQAFVNNANAFVDGQYNYVRWYKDLASKVMTFIDIAGQVASAVSAPPIATAAVLYMTIPLYGIVPNPFFDPAGAILYQNMMSDYLTGAIPDSNSAIQKLLVEGLFYNMEKNQLKERNTNLMLQEGSNYGYDTNLDQYVAAQNQANLTEDSTMPWADETTTYYTNKMDSLLYDNRLAFSNNNGTGSIDAGAGTTYSLKDGDVGTMKTNDFITSRGDGKVVLRGAAMASHQQTIAENYVKVSMYLSILKAYQDALEAVVGDMFGRSKSGVTSSFDGQIDAVVGKEQGVVDAYRGDIDARVETINTQYEKSKKIQEATIELSRAGVKVGLQAARVAAGVYALVPLPFVGYGLYPTYVAVESAFKAAGLIEQGAALLARSVGMFGFANIDYDSTNPYPDNITDPTFLPSLEDPDPDQYNTEVTPASQVFNNLGLDESPQFEGASEAEKERLADQFGSYSMMDELEKEQLAIMSDPDNILTDSNGVSGFAGDFQQLDFEKLIDVYSTLTNINQIRTFLTMIDQAMYNAKQNTLRAMFGGNAGSAHGALNVMASGVERYNSAIMGGVFQMLQSEASSRMMAINDRTQGQLNAVLEGTIFAAAAIAAGVPGLRGNTKAASLVATGGMATDTYIDKAVKFIKGAEVVSVASSLSKIAVGVALMETVQQNNPQITSQLLNFEEAPVPDDAATEEQRQNAKLQGKPDEATVNFDPNNPAKAGQVAGADKNFGISGDVSQQGGRQRVDMTGQARTQALVSRQARQMELLREISLSLSEAKADIAEDMGGGAAAKGAYRQIQSIMKQQAELERRGVEMIYSAMKAAVEAYNRGADRMMGGVSEMVSTGVKIVATKLGESAEKMQAKETAPKTGMGSASESKAAAGSNKAASVDSSNQSKNTGSGFSSSQLRLMARVLNISAPLIGLLLVEAINQMQNDDAAPSLLGGDKADYGLEESDMLEDNPNLQQKGSKAKAKGDGVQETPGSIGFLATDQLETAILANSILSGGYEVRKAMYEDIGAIYSKAGTALAGVLKDELEKAAKDGINAKRAKDEEKAEQNLVAQGPEALKAKILEAIGQADSGPSKGLFSPATPLTTAGMIFNGPNAEQRVLQRAISAQGKGMKDDTEKLKTLQKDKEALETEKAKLQAEGGSTADIEKKDKEITDKGKEIDDQKKKINELKLSFVDDVVAKIRNNVSDREGIKKEAQLQSKSLAEQGRDRVGMNDVVELQNFKKDLQKVEKDLLVRGEQDPETVQLLKDAQSEAQNLADMASGNITAISRAATAMGYDGGDRLKEALESGGILGKGGFHKDFLKLSDAEKRQALGKAFKAANGGGVRNDLRKIMRGEINNFGGAWDLHQQEFFRELVDVSSQAGFDARVTDLKSSTQAKLAEVERRLASGSPLTASGQPTELVSAEGMAKVRTDVARVDQSMSAKDAVLAGLFPTLMARGGMLNLEIGADGKASATMSRSPGIGLVPVEIVNPNNAGQRTTVFAPKGTTPEAAEKMIAQSAGQIAQLIQVDNQRRQLGIQVVARGAVLEAQAVAIAGIMGGIQRTITPVKMDDGRSMPYVDDSGDGPDPRAAVPGKARLDAVLASPSVVVGDVDAATGKRLMSVGTQAENAGNILPMVVIDRVNVKVRSNVEDAGLASESRRVGMAIRDYIKANGPSSTLVAEVVDRKTGAPSIRVYDEATEHATDGLTLANKPNREAPITPIFVRVAPDQINAGKLIDPALETSVLNAVAEFRPVAYVDAARNRSIVDAVPPLNVPTMVEVDVPEAKGTVPVRTDGVNVGPNARLSPEVEAQVRNTTMAALQNVSMGAVAGFLVASVGKDGKPALKTYTGKENLDDYIGVGLTRADGESRVVLIPRTQTIDLDSPEVQQKLQTPGNVDRFTMNADTAAAMQARKAAIAPAQDLFFAQVLDSVDGAMVLRPMKEGESFANFEKQKVATSRDVGGVLTEVEGSERVILVKKGEAAPDFASAEVRAALGAGADDTLAAKGASVALVDREKMVNLQRDVAVALKGALAKLEMMEARKDQLQLATRLAGETLDQTGLSESEIKAVAQVLDQEGVGESKQVDSAYLMRRVVRGATFGLLGMDPKTNRLGLGISGEATSKVGSRALNPNDVEITDALKDRLRAQLGRVVEDGQDKEQKIERVIAALDKSETRALESRVVKANNTAEQKALNELEHTRLLDSAVDPETKKTVASLIALYENIEKSTLETKQQNLQTFSQSLINNALERQDVAGGMWRYFGTNTKAVEKQRDGMLDAEARGFDRRQGAIAFADIKDQTLEKSRFEARGASFVADYAKAKQEAEAANKALRSGDRTRIVGGDSDSWTPSPEGTSIMTQAGKWADIVLTPIYSLLVSNNVDFVKKDSQFQVAADVARNRDQNLASMLRAEAALRAEVTHQLQIGDKQRAAELLGGALSSGGEAGRDLVSRVLQDFAIYDDANAGKADDEKTNLFRETIELMMETYGSNANMMTALGSAVSKTVEKSNGRAAGFDLDDAGFLTRQRRNVYDFFMEPMTNRSGRALTENEMVQKTLKLINANNGNVKAGTIAELETQMANTAAERLSGVVGLDRLLRNMTSADADRMVVGLSPEIQSRIMVSVASGAIQASNFNDAEKMVESAIAAREKLLLPDARASQQKIDQANRDLDTALFVYAEEAVGLFGGLVGQEIVMSKQSSTTGKGTSEDMGQRILEDAARRIEEVQARVGVPLSSADLGAQLREVGRLGRISNEDVDAVAFRATYRVDRAIAAVDAAQLNLAGDQIDTVREIQYTEGIRTRLMDGGADALEKRDFLIGRFAGDLGSALNRVTDDTLLSRQAGRSVAALRNLTDAMYRQQTVEVPETFKKQTILEDGVAVSDFVLEKREMLMKAMESSLDMADRARAEARKELQTLSDIRNVVLVRQESSIAELTRSKVKVAEVVKESLGNGDMESVVQVLGAIKTVGGDAGIALIKEIGTLLYQTEEKQQFKEYLHRTEERNENFLSEVSQLQKDRHEAKMAFNEALSQAPAIPVSESVLNQLNALSDREKALKALASDVGLLAPNSPQLKELLADPTAANQLAQLVAQGLALDLKSAYNLLAKMTNAVGNDQNLLSPFAKALGGQIERINETKIESQRIDIKKVEEKLKEVDKSTIEKAKVESLMSAVRTGYVAQVYTNQTATLRGLPTVESRANTTSRILEIGGPAAVEAARTMISEMSSSDPTNAGALISELHHINPEHANTLLSGLISKLPLSDSKEIISLSKTLEVARSGIEGRGDGVNADTTSLFNQADTFQSQAHLGAPDTMSQTLTQMMVTGDSVTGKIMGLAQQISDNLGISPTLDRMLAGQLNTVSAGEVQLGGHAMGQVATLAFATQNPDIFQVDGDDITLKKIPTDAEIGAMAGAPAGLDNAFFGQFDSAAQLSADIAGFPLLAQADARNLARIADSVLKPAAFLASHIQTAGRNDAATMLSKAKLRDRLGAMLTDPSVSLSDRLASAATLSKVATEEMLAPLGPQLGQLAIAAFSPAGTAENRAIAAELLKPGSVSAGVMTATLRQAASDEANAKTLERADARPPGFADGQAYDIQTDHLISQMPANQCLNATIPMATQFNSLSIEAKVTAMGDPVFAERLMTEAPKDYVNFMMSPNGTDPGIRDTLQGGLDWFLLNTQGLLPKILPKLLIASEMAGMNTIESGMRRAMAMPDVEVNQFSINCQAMRATILEAITSGQMVGMESDAFKTLDGLRKSGQIISSRSADMRGTMVRLADTIKKHHEKGVSYHNELVELAATLGTTDPKLAGLMTSIQSQSGKAGDINGLTQVIGALSRGELPHKAVMMDPLLDVFGMEAMAGNGPGATVPQEDRLAAADLFTNRGLNT